MTYTNNMKNITMKSVLQTRFLAAIMTLLLFLSANIATAQQAESNNAMSLSLEEATRIALDQNFSIDIAESDRDKSRAQYRQTNAVFLPQLSFEYNALSTNDPLNVFGFKLKQEVVEQADFNPMLLNDPDVTQNYSAAFKVQQPLLNPDMFLQRSAVKNQLNSADEQVAGTRNYVEFQVQNQYYSLILHHRQLGVLETALQTAAEHRRQAQNFFEEGLISKEDFLAARVYELEMESRKLNTENQLAKVEEEMALLLGMDGSVKITPTEDLERMNLAVLPEDLITAPINNAQTRAIEYRVKAAENMVKSSGFSFLPKINLFGSYEFNDADFAGFDASSYMIGANLTWNIFSGYSKIGKVMEAKADYRKAQTMQENHRMEQENQVRQAYRALEHAQQELELTDESIAQSEEDVKIRTNRYEQGMERTTDLLEAETKLAEARLKNVAALYKYNMSIATLEMLLEKDLNN